MDSIEDYVTRLKLAYPQVGSVWLIGSRANGRATEKSDWDLVVFADEETLKALAKDIRFHQDDVDLLVVFDTQGNFETPWGRKKSGSLLSWKWEHEAVNIATYEAIKFIPDVPGSSRGEMQEERLHAIKITA